MTGNTTHAATVPAKQPEPAAAVLTTDLETSRADDIERFLSAAYGTPVRIHRDDGPRLLRYQRTDAGAFAVGTACQRRWRRGRPARNRAAVPASGWTVRQPRCDRGCRRYLRVT